LELPLVTVAVAVLSTCAELEELDVDELVLDWLAADVAHSTDMEIMATFANVSMDVSFFA